MSSAPRGFPSASPTRCASPARSSSSRSRGRSLIVCRNRDGELRAHHNVCRHRGARLVTEPQGEVARFFQCPYHAWAYDLDGACLGTPLFTPEAGIPEDQRDVFDMSRGEGVRQGRPRPLPGSCRRVGLPRLRLPRPGGARAPRRARRSPGAPRRLPAGRAAPRSPASSTRSRRTGSSIAENFMEYYHLPWVHPGLVKVSPMSAHHRWQGRGHVHGLLHLADRGEHRRRRLGRAAADVRALRRTTRSARDSPGCFLPWRSTRCRTTPS